MQGNLVPKKSIFPSGMKALADYVHSKGLKIGIYGDADIVFLLSLFLKFGQEITVVHCAVRPYFVLT